jgi:tRNA threonylcarbamoyladenosine biosynthesis protein TsaB
MKVLAIDSSCSFLSAALLNGQDIYHKETEAGTRHSELVMGLIDDLLKEASLAPCDLEYVLCMGGPGSFTGLRIGYSIAKALALSLSIPFIPVPTLDCIAFPFFSSPRLVVPVIPARKNAFFCALFRNGERLIPDSDVSKEQLANLIQLNCKTSEDITITGPAADLFDGIGAGSLKVIISCEKRGFAKELLGIAKTRDMFHNDCSAYLASGPEYIRKTDAEISFFGN